MKLDLYQIDAFTSEVFGGNPAAVVPLKSWLPDETLQNIATENNLSETAFFVPKREKYNLRWFTPGGEVDLCGHATLATAYTLFEQHGYTGETITFSSRSGDLFVHKKANGFMMNFPAWDRKPATAPQSLTDALGAQPSEFFLGHDAMAVFDDPDQIRTMTPDFRALKNFTQTRGIIVTAHGDDNYDFISRAFFPNLNIEEDPVTGSAHCILTPYWAERFNKTTLKAYQASTRGGNLLCELKDDRVEITGQAVLYMKGEIHI
jgi:PhzF family phenazine biosynthesis protein